MNSTLGYEYQYHISMQEAMPSGYEFDRSNRKKSLLFEFRTNFILKTRQDVRVSIDSEIFHACVVEGKKSLQHLEILAGDKLNEYSMPKGKINALIGDAVAIADLLASHPQHASLQVIPIVVSIDVCTVQQEGERLTKTLDRAIRTRI